jgi:hypothetical protein
MQDRADTTRFFGGDAMSLTVYTQGTGATVSNPGGREHTHRPVVFGASFLRIKRGPLPTTQGAVRLRKKISPCQASCSRCTCPVRGTEGWPSRGAVRGWQGFSLRGGKLGETHRGWLPLSAEFLAQIPHPLRKDLPGFLTAWCVGTPPVAVLLPILISEHGFKAAAMQVELDDIGGAEAEGGQGREKELIDHAITSDANRTGSRPGGMRGDDHARAVSLRGYWEFATLKEVPAHPTFRMHELLIGRQGQTCFDRCQIKQSVIFAAHQPGDPCHRQIRDDGSIAVLAKDMDEGLTWG